MRAYGLTRPTHLFDRSDVVNLRESLTGGERQRAKRILILGPFDGFSFDARRGQDAWFDVRGDYDFDFDDDDLDDQYWDRREIVPAYVDAPRPLATLADVIPPA